MSFPAISANTHHLPGQRMAIPQRAMHASLSSSVLPAPPLLLPGCVLPQHALWAGGGSDSDAVMLQSGMRSTFAIFAYVDSPCDQRQTERTDASAIRCTITLPDFCFRIAYRCPLDVYANSPAANITTNSAVVSLDDWVLSRRCLTPKSETEVQVECFALSSSSDCKNS